MKLIQDFVYQTKNIPRAIFLAILLAIAYLFFNENGTQAKSKLKGLLKQRWLATFIAYAAFILTTTLISRQNTIPYVRIFDSFGFRGDPKWDSEIVENILIFIPYTFFYIKAFKPQTPWKAALKLSAITSVTIEICQLVFWLGSFQLADIVHNTLSGMIGCGIWYLAEWIKTKYKRQKETATENGKENQELQKTNNAIYHFYLINKETMIQH